MSEYQARIRWNRQPNERFVDSRYSRAHSWEFDGGLTVPASSAVSSVPLPYSKAENVDPEEALVAAISSCHMLTFLYLAGKEQFVVDSYDDLARGSMTRNAQGRMAVTSVQLAPKIAFSGAKAPTGVDVDRLHHAAHEECFIANSVLTEISVAGDWVYSPQRTSTGGMMSDHREELSDTFSRMSDEELTERWSSGKLTDVAVEVARAEFAKRQITPPELPSELADEETGPEHDVEFATVARSLEPLQIEMLRSRLRAEGIEAFTVDGGINQVNSLISIAVGGVRLMVPRESADEARRIIKLVRSGTFALRDDETGA
jgi:organic hydroperoxide reductase OsmC/OhrA